MKPSLLVGLIGVLAAAVGLTCGILLGQRANRMPSFEYRVCLVQEARVTFVNGAWQGAIPMDLKKEKESLESCPLEWEYLVKAGEDAWELAAVVPFTHLQDQPARELYLKRPKK